MTSVGLGEMFEGDFADTCTGKFCAYVDGGPSRRSSVLCIVSSARYAMHFIICKVFYEFYSMHLIQCILFYELSMFSIHFILCIVTIHCILHTM